MRGIDFVVLVRCSTNVIIYSRVNSEPSRGIVYVPRGGVAAGRHANEERLQIQWQLHREAQFWQELGGQSVFARAKQLRFN